MHIVTNLEMRKIEQHVIEEIGIPALVLMETAGRAIAEEAVRFSRELVAKNGKTECVQGFRWLVIVGKGNNGGDGLVCARHLVAMGYEADVLYAVPPEQLTGDAAVQRDIIRKMGVPHSCFHQDATEGEAVQWSKWNGIIDCLLGTGTKGEPREPFAALIHEMNSSGLPIISADIPSGLNADTGEMPGACVRASLTVALSQYKRGLLLYPGAEAAGEVVVRSIGIPDHIISSAGVNTFLLDAKTLKQRFGLALPPQRHADTHKGTYGHVLVAAGSAAMSGAGLLCARAALRAGSGLVSWAVPDQLSGKLIGLLPEAMLRGLADGGSGEWSRTSAQELALAAAGKQAVVIGPGLGRWPGDAAWLRELWQRIDAPLVLDADALNMLADDTCRQVADAPAAQQSPWPPRTAPAVITPHPGEMARLCGLPTSEVQRERIGIASSYAQAHNVIVVLKGARTIIAAPNGETYVNTTGNPGMATGGSGDVLAGIIGSLLGQGLNALLAAALGVYWHGLAGDRAAASRYSESSLLAGDIIEAL